MTDDQDCLFCKIVSGEQEAIIVHEAESAIAFRDIHPHAPTHVLVVPREHFANAAEVAAKDPLVLAEMFDVAAKVAEESGLKNGYRTVFNTGPDAQQTVLHAHLHLLGGRGFTWPPG